MKISLAYIAHAPSHHGKDIQDFFKESHAGITPLTAVSYTHPRKKVIAESDDKEEEDVNVDAYYIVDEKAKTATLTARGVKKAEEFFGLENLSDPEMCIRDSLMTVSTVCRSVSSRSR